MRFVQMSCLGASASAPSRMLRAKAAAEESVLREFPTVITFCFYLIKLTFIRVLSFCSRTCIVSIVKMLFTSFGDNKDGNLAPFFS